MAVSHKCSRSMLNQLVDTERVAVGSIVWLNVTLIHSRLGGFDVAINQRAELIRVPVLPCRPPLLETGISRYISDSAVKATPKARIEGPIEKMQIKAISRS